MKVRQLLSADRSSLLEHYWRLNLLDRTLRFLRPVPDRFLERYAQNAIGQGRYLVGAFEDRQLLAVGELIRHADDDWAEVAVSVDQTFRGRGLATSLIQKLVEIAKEWNVRDVRIDCLPGNQQVHRMISRFSGYGVHVAAVWDAQIRLAFSSKRPGI